MKTIVLETEQPSAATEESGVEHSVFDLDYVLQYS